MDKEEREWERDLNKNFPASTDDRLEHSFCLLEHLSKMDEISLLSLASLLHVRRRLFRHRTKAGLTRTQLEEVPERVERSFITAKNEKKCSNAFQIWWERKRFKPTRTKKKTRRTRTDTMRGRRRESPQVSDRDKDKKVAIEGKESGKAFDFDKPEKCSLGVSSMASLSSSSCELSP